MLLRSLRLLLVFLLGLVWGGDFLVGLVVGLGIFFFLFLFFLFLLFNCYHYASHFIYYTDLNDKVSTIVIKHIW